MNQVKVVELKVEGNRKANLPPIVHTIRQQTKKQLAELLQNLFNNMDDALFELADRSQSDQSQELYFDSMRSIRLHRKAVATAFMRSFFDSFNTAFSPNSGDEPVLDDEDETDFTLLGQDELEMTVAVSGIVSKVTSQYSLAIMQLTKRLDYLSKVQTISERSNPLGPFALSSAFAEALSLLEVDIKIRIILMKMFERFVMERLGPIYDTANRALIDADVLADLKNKPPRSASRKTPTSSGYSGKVEDPVGPATTHSGFASQQQAQGSIGFQTVQSLLAGVRGPEASAASGNSNPGHIGTGAQGGAGTGQGSGQGTVDGIMVLPPLESIELVQALNHLQNSSSSEQIDINQVPELTDLRTLVLAQPGAENKSLGQADDDTVNFVGMLFDYILNDRNLAIPMKALIGRLQIPIVKLAILDKTFFEKGSHPARALLNELSSAGIGWSSAQELKRDALYNKIESIVLRVLNEFADNPDIFEELVHELRDFVSTDNRRSILVEQRVKESEAGKAKTHSAKLKVQNLVNQKACGLRLPAEAGKFISEVWTRVLTMRMLKYGESSSAWTEGVTTLDDLLWALQPLADLDDIEQRDDRTPQLLNQTVNGMNELGCPREEVDSFEEWLNTHLENLSENDRAFVEEDERPAPEFAEELVEEIVLAAPPQTFDETSVKPEAISQLRLITEGSWVEVREDEDRKVRCKLATITQPGDNYVFVNRRGMKVLEKSRAELAVLVEEDNLKRIDESQVFDRALQSVIGNLRRMQRERSIDS